MVAAKSDLYQQGEGVDRSIAQQWSSHHNIEWFEVSAKNNVNVDLVFASVARKCLSTESLRKAGVPKAAVSTAKTTAVVAKVEGEQGCAC